MTHYSEQRDQEENLRLRRLNSGAAEVHFHLANAVNELKMAMVLLVHQRTEGELLSHVISITKLIKESQ